MFLHWCAESGGGNYGSSRYDGGGRGDRSRDSELVTQEDTIFVSGMPDHATEDDIKDHFGSIGIIKVKTHLKKFPVIESVTLCCFENIQNQL